MLRGVQSCCAPGAPRFPLTITGHGQLRHAYLKNPERLVALGGVTPAAWGLLFDFDFDFDARRRRWTLCSPDPEYTAMLAAAAATGALKLEFPVMTAKPPGWNSG